MKAGRDHVLGDFEVSAFSRAAEACRLLRRDGLRHAYGLEENAALTTAEGQDLATIEAAIARLFAADDRRRRGEAPVTGRAHHARPGIDRTRCKACGQAIEPTSETKTSYRHTEHL